MKSKKVYSIVFEFTEEEARILFALLAAQYKKDLVSKGDPILSPKAVELYEELYEIF